MPARGTFLSFAGSFVFVVFFLEIGVCLADASKPTPEARFWRWFVAHKQAVATIQRGDEPIANELGRELKSVDADLVFETKVGEGEHELIISADGLTRAFPAAKKLVAAAPAIPDWKVIAFRPRKAGYTIQIQGIKLGPNDVGFRNAGLCVPKSFLDGET